MTRASPRSIIAGLWLAALAASAPAAAQSVTNLVCDNGLSFGSLIAGTGTVTIDPATGTRGKTGDVVLLGSGQFSSGGRATCTVTLASGFDYSISFASSTVQLTRSGGGSMDLTLARSPSGTLTGTGGTSTFYIGGSLAVSASQAAGSYSGSYSVTVAYP